MSGFLQGELAMLSVSKGTCAAAGLGLTLPPHLCWVPSASAASLQNCQMGLNKGSVVDPLQGVLSGKTLSVQCSAGRSLVCEVGEVGASLRSGFAPVLGQGCG